MKCKAIQVQGPYKFSWEAAEIGYPTPEESIVEVHYSSLCGTDHQVYTGELVYYRTGVAQYPIITGHEWCGTCEGQPVVGMCILGCGCCDACNESHPIWCQSRREVGIVNKNGAHAERIIMPSEMLLPIPEIAPKYALIEPLAVAIHGLRRVDLKNRKILILGYGSIGKLCGEVLTQWGHSFEIYDPKYSTERTSDADLIIECSGDATSFWRDYLERRGIEILLFGFEYKPIDPGILVSNEINLITSLGSNRQDFIEAIEIMRNIEFNSFEVIPLKLFDGYKYLTKTIFNNRDI